MKLQSLITTSALSVFLSLGFSQCTSTKNAAKISNTIDVLNEINPKAYYQNWVAGVRGGGAGTDVYIHKSVLKEKKVDGIYFQNKVSKLAPPKEPNVFYVAHFKRAINQQEMSGLPHNDQKSDSEFPFELKYNEAVISYITEGKTSYFKLTNIVKKESLDYPSAPKH